MPLFPKVHRVTHRFSALSIALLATAAIQAAELKVSRDIVYSEPPGEQLKADIYRPAGDAAAPAVLVVHGGAWTIGNKSHLSFAARQIAEAGFCAVAINYRLAPKHPFPAQLEDCRSAVTWIRKHAADYRIDPSRIAGYGYSAGGHLVALLAASETCEPDGGQEAGRPDCRLQAVVAGGAPCDFRLLPEDERALAYWLGGPRKEKPDVYQLASPAKFVSAACPPMFFFHGENDALVPLLTVKGMTGQLARAGVKNELFIVPGKGHILAMWDTEALRRGIAFLKASLDAR